MRRIRLVIVAAGLAIATVGGPIAFASNESPGKHPGPGPGASFNCAGPEKPSSCPPKHAGSR